MPIFTYACSHGHSTDELYSRWEDAPSFMDCPECSRRAEKRSVYRATTVGPISADQIDAMNHCLLGPKRMANGERFRSAKDIERYEQERGWYRAEAHKQRVAQQEQLHEAAVQGKVFKEDGLTACCDHIDTTEIMKATGWDKKKTQQWKETSDAVTKNLDKSSLPPTNPRYTTCTPGVDG